MLHCSLIWGYERESWRYEIQLSLRGMGENILLLEGMKSYPRLESSIQLSQQFCCSLVVMENVTHMAKMLGWTCHPGGRVELCLILFLRYREVTWTCIVLVRLNFQKIKDTAYHLLSCHWTWTQLIWCLSQFVFKENSAIMKNKLQGKKKY